VETDNVMNVPYATFEEVELSKYKILPQPYYPQHELSLSLTRTSDSRIFRIRKREPLSNHPCDGPDMEVRERSVPVRSALPAEHIAKCWGGAAQRRLSQGRGA